jgi:hypothetical protein
VKRSKTTTRHTALNSDNNVKIVSKILAEVFVEPPQKNIDLKQDVVELLRHRRGLHVNVGQKSLDIIPAFGMRYSSRAVAAEGTRTVSSPRFLGSTSEGRARSPTCVEKSREEDDDEAIANTSGSTGYGRRKKAGGAQVVDCGEDESMGSGSIGEVHVDMWGCWREGWGSFVGHN